MNKKPLILGIESSCDETAASIISESNQSGFFRSGSSKSIEPGDTIVVPFTTSTFSGLRAAQDVTTIVYELAVAAAAISSFQD